ncbi:MAG: CPBP family intramembrane metalloprotease [Phycisphaeraceae bacterium]|nr:CPBP family intramembrane metalloprotease [Phycisphaeraceae bacterium]
MPETESLSPPLLPSAPVPDRVRWAAEVGATLAVCILPIVVASFASYMGTSHGRDVGFGWMYGGGIAHSVSILSFALFVMWRSGEGWKEFGFVRPRVGIDLGLAFSALVLSSILVYGYAILLYSIAPELYPTSEDSYQFAKPTTALERAIALAHAVANGCTEEIVLWGLLFTRLRNLIGSGLVPALAVAGIFASYHIYQGFYAAGSIFIIGIVHGSIFLWKPRLLPLMIAHVALDLQILL